MLGNYNVPPTKPNHPLKQKTTRLAERKWVNLRENFSLIKSFCPSQTSISSSPEFQINFILVFKLRS